MTKIYRNLFQLVILLFMNSQIITASNLTHFSGEEKSTQPFSIIKGKITDEKNEPIVSANIKIKGTSRGAITDVNGEFSLDVNEGDVLLISAIGLTSSEVLVSKDMLTKGNLNINLKHSNTALDEVVVSIGYGSGKKSEMTGSSAKIKGTEIINIPTLTATQAMQGKAAGVQIINSGAPGSAPNIRIRGTGSILGGVDPLYVVDGIITDDIRNINNSDILSMDILKDAASTAIYGVRGANGVVIITTKGGRKGKTQITYDAYYGVKRMVNKVEMAKPNLFTNYSNEAAGTTAIKPTDVTGATDWMDAITRMGSIQSHALSVSGGSDKSTFFFSANYLKEEGILKGNDYQRVSVRSNNDYQLTNKLKVGNTFSYSNYVSNNKPFSLFTEAYNAAPIYNAKNPDGSYGSTTTSNVGNPLAKLELTNDRNIGHRLQGSVFGEYTILKGLSFKTSFAADAGFNNTVNYNPVFFVSPDQKNTRSSLSLTRDNGYHWVWDNYFSYVIQKGKHDLKLTLGHTAERFDGGWMSASKKDIPAQEQYWNFSFGDPLSIAVSSGSQDNYGRRESYFARGLYNFGGKYFVSATIRRDGASKFPVQNRWGNFPSIGLGWNILKEDFMKNITSLSQLKLRASYGLIGNDNITPGQFVTQFSSGLNSVFGNTIYSGAIPNQIIDPNLKWEINKEFNVGLEFGLFDNALTGEVELYNKKTENALYLVSLPGVAGDVDNVYTTNAATIQNKGLELSLAHQHTVSKDFSFRLRGNITFNQNTVLDVGQGGALDYGGLDNGYTCTRVIQGQPIGVFWIYQTNGIFQSDAEVSAYPHIVSAKAGDKKIVDTNGDGKIDDKDRIYAGSYQPKCYYGMSFSFYYKAFDLAMDVIGNAGNKVFNGKKTVRYGGNYNVEYDVATNRWTPNNHTNDNPRAYNGVPLPTDYFLESGAFVRINNLTLGYTLPKVISNKYKVGRLRVYAASQNLYTYKKFTGYTPELPGAPYDSGIEKHIYPTSATYMIGVNVEF